MAQPQTAFDLLRQIAHDLDITFVAGQLWPPFEGQMWFGHGTLNEILVPDGEPRQVALLLAPSGQSDDHVRIGRAKLDSEGLARLAQAASDASGYVYQGRLALLTPAEWLRLRGAAAAEISGVAGETLLDTAHSAGWPHFGDQAVLFLDDQPVFTLLGQTNLGRNVALLIGDIAEPAADPVV